jgi:hypothetical protein
LAAGDRHRAKQALEQARAIDPLVRSFQQALTVGYQVARLAPFRRRALGELDPYASAARACFSDRRGSGRVWRAAR